MKEFILNHCVAIYYFLVLIAFLWIRRLDKPLCYNHMAEIKIKPIKMSSTFMEFDKIPESNPRNEITFF